MDTKELQAHLHQHIPLSKAMGVEVVSAAAEGVELSAPLAPNINHRETVFGGSASAVAILSAWALLYLRLQSERLNCRVVIHKNTMYYDRPMTGAFTALSIAPKPAAWNRFVDTLKRKRRARIAVTATLQCNGENAGRLEGDFVALAMRRHK